MNKILDIFSKNLENGNYFFIIFLAIIVIVFKFEKIFKSFDSIKKNKLNFLFDLEKKSFLDDNTKETIHESINNNIFKVTTGIKTNKYMREKIIELYKEKKGEVTLYDIKNAISFLKIKNNKIVIELKKSDYYSYIFSIIFSLITIWLALMLIILFPFITDTNSISFKQNLTAIVMGIGLFFIALPILKDALAYKAARKIKQIIENSK